MAGELALLLVLFATAAWEPVQFAPEPPGPIVRGPKGIVAAGDTLAYTISWGAGARAASYDVTTVAAATNGLWSVVADSNASGKWTSGNGTGQMTTTANVTALLLKTWLSSIPWDSATFIITVVSRNSFGVSAPVSATWRVLRKPGPPGPIIVDSSKIVTATLVLPSVVNLALGTSRTVCAFKQYGNGAVTEWTADKPSCDSIYTRYVPLAARQLVQPTQQAHTDSLVVTCVAWQSSLPASVAVTPTAPCSSAATARGNAVTAAPGNPFFRYAVKS